MNWSRFCEIRRLPTRLPKRSAARAAISRKAYDHADHSFDHARAAGRAARVRRMDIDRAVGGRVVRPAVFYELAARGQSLPVVLGLERELDHRGAAAVHMDGRN